MSTDLYINGSLVNRPSARITLNRLTLSLDAPDVLEFTERCTVLPGEFTAGAVCSLYVDGTPRFLGQVRGRYPSGVGRGPIDVGYRALGTNWLANRIAITNIDGTGRIVYNLPQTDDFYVASQSGLSVGAILELLFKLHWPQMQAIGITGWSETELKLLTVVPPEPVIIQGRLWNQVTELISLWCNKYAAWIDGTGYIHVQSQLTFANRTITLDYEPAVLDQISQDTSECYTRVVVRGGAWIEGAYLSLKEGTLTQGWTPAQQASWTLNDFYNPKGSSDAGAVQTETSTTLVLKSDDGTKTFATNALATLNAEVWAYNPLATGITFTEQRRVTANTALAAGGTYTVTVDSPFNQVGYSRYQVRGQYATQSLVWRKYNVVPSFVAMHLVPRFSHSFAWSPSDGAVTQTDTPAADVCLGLIQVPALFDIVPSDGIVPGYIVFNQPVVKVFGTIPNLLAGGGKTDGIPTDIKVLVPYSRGAISAVWPANDISGNPVYGGTAYTGDGVQDTYYYDVPTWLDYHDAPNYLQLAKEKYDTLSNTVTEGTITYYAKYTDMLTLGKSLNIAKAENLTGYEAINAPIRAVVLDYAPDGGASPWLTRISFSNRLRPFAGDRLYAHPTYGSQANALYGNQWGQPSLFTAPQPTRDQMAIMGRQGRVNQGVDPTAFGTDPAAGLADPTARAADPLAAAGVWTPDAGGIAEAADWGIAGPSSRAPVSQDEQVRRDQERAANREFNQGVAALDAELRRMKRKDTDQGMKRLGNDPDFPIRTLTE